jgi:hypothetical protein
MKLDGQTGGLIDHPPDDILCVGLGVIAPKSQPFADDRPPVFDLDNAVMDLDHR